MLKKLSIALLMMVLGITAQAQKKNPADTLMNDIDMLASDSTIDYDELFRDFESFMDSILTPKSYLMPSFSLSRGYFSFTSKDNELLETSPRITFTPMLTYYHKSGLGITATGYIMNDKQNTNLYQGSITPSYDYLENHDIAAGFSYTRYFTKDSLPFYTSPLKNDLNAYFTYRKWWMKPSVALSYGWGSRTDYEQREELIQSLRLRPRGYTYVNTTESVADFSVQASVRHDFYWLDVLGYNDHIRFTPQIAFTSGTQKFGFNQKSNTYGTTILTATNVLYNSENVYLDDQVEFQPLSLTLFLRGEYSIGKFFLQPQLLLDYYFPAPSKNFSTLFSINMGLIL